MRRTFLAVPVLLALCSGAFAQTLRTTTEPMVFNGIGTRYFYPGFSVTTEPLVFNGVGTRYLYPGFSVTTAPMIFQGTALSRVDLQGQANTLHQNTAPKLGAARTRMTSGLSSPGSLRSPPPTNPAHQLSAPHAMGSSAASGLLSDADPAPPPAADDTPTSGRPQTYYSGDGTADAGESSGE